MRTTEGSAGLGDGVNDVVLRIPGDEADDGALWLTGDEVDAGGTLPLVTGAGGAGTDGAL